jgi:hypothetical protein
LRDGVLNFTFPQRTGGDRSLVLPEPEILKGAAKLRTQFMLNVFPQRRQGAMGAFIILA